MYHHIRGEVIELGPSRLVLEAAGVGYELAIPFSTYSAITTQLEGNGVGQPLRLLTHHYVREDVCKLFGFVTEAERVVFRAVLGISGLGPTAALTLLSSVRADEFRAIVEAGDPEPLERVKGIGKRLASRLCVELKDRLDALSAAVTREHSSQAAGTDPRIANASAPRREAVTALVGLGYAEKEAKSRVEAALSLLEAAAAGPGTSVDDVDDDGAGEEAKGNVTLEALLYESLRQR